MRVGKHTGVVVAQISLCVIKAKGLFTQYDFSWLRLQFGFYLQWVTEELSQSHSVNTSIESCATDLLRQKESQLQSEKKNALCERALRNVALAKRDW